MSAYRVTQQYVLHKERTKFYQIITIVRARDSADKSGRGSDCVVVTHWGRRPKLTGFFAPPKPARDGKIKISPFRLIQQGTDYAQATRLAKQGRGYEEWKTESNDLASDKQLLYWLEHQFTLNPASGGMIASYMELSATEEKKVEISPPDKVIKTSGPSLEKLIELNTEWASW